MDGLSQDLPLSWPSSNWMEEQGPEFIDDSVLPQPELLDDAAMSEDSTLIPEDDWTPLIDMDKMMEYEDTDTTAEPSLLLDNGVDVDIHKWNRFCELHHESLCCYRHNLDTLEATPQNDDESLDSIAQQYPIGELRQKLETLEDIMRPFVKRWSGAEKQHPELRDHWYGKGVRSTPPTWADTVHAEIDGRALAEWACTLYKATQPYIQTADTLEIPISGDSAQVFTQSASSASSVCTITMSDWIVDQCEDTCAAEGATADSIF